jgi:hypothetical protein
MRRAKNGPGYREARAANREVFFRSEILGTNYRKRRTLLPAGSIVPARVALNISLQQEPCISVLCFLMPRVPLQERHEQQSKGAKHDLKKTRPR